MEFDPTYTLDSEFSKVLARREDVDLTRVVLEIARDEYPDVDDEIVMNWIAARASELTSPIAKAFDEYDALTALGECLADRHSVFGDDAHYNQADSHYLHRVIETGRGIPIALSVLYMAVADKLGLNLFGVSAPLHFLCGSDTCEGMLFIDAFNNGRVLERDDCLRQLQELTNLPLSQIEPTLKPARPRAIVLRTLNNLKRHYAETEEWKSAWRAQHRLCALEPTSYGHSRDLAVFSLKADHPGQAMELLEGCLKRCPEKERETLEIHLESARQQLAKWN